LCHYIYICCFKGKFSTRLLLVVHQGRFVELQPTEGDEQDIRAPETETLPKVDTYQPSATAVEAGSVEDLAQRGFIDIII
jgi:hypothetical protein